MAIRIAEVKSSSLSDDKREAIVVGYGKYVGNVELRFASECLDDLIETLVRMKGDRQPSASPRLTSNAVGLASPDQNGGGGANSDEIRFEVPKNFSVAEDTSGRGLVLLILNRRLENQRGYALMPDAAKQLAGGLTKRADAMLAQKPQARPVQ
jgi:hypothetical protein